MGNDDNNEELKRYLKEVRSVYSGIAGQIDSLIMILNETDQGDDHLVLGLAAKIDNFLKEITAFVKKEKKLASDKKIIWSQDKKTRFLALVQKLITEIKQLEKFIEMEKKRPQHNLVIQINRLNQEIKEIMAGEETML